MFDHTTHRGIGLSISNRASLMSELAKKIAEQDRADTVLQERLLEKAPEELREWLSEDAVLTNLFKYGRCGTKLNFNKDYGFGDFADVEAKMRALRKAWKDVVQLRIDKPEPHRVEIHLSALM